MGFWCTVFANIIASVTGVFLGVLGALWINRVILSYALREKRQWLLQSLHENLKSNPDLIDKFYGRFSNSNMSQLNSSSVILINADTSILESTASFKYEVIENLVLNKLALCQSAQDW